ncbi:extracellular solute-binding protein [Streptosporangium sp. NPDC004631]
MSRDRLRRTRLGAPAGALALVVCVFTGAAGADRRAPAPVPSASPAVTTPSASASASSGSDPSPSPTPSASIGKGEGTLQVLAFQGQVEYGAAVSDANWVSPFEKLTGCRVSRLDRVQTSEEMADRLRGNSYDVVSPAPELAGRLMAEGAVAPVDTALLRSYKDIPKRLRELPAVRQKGKVYGVPYLWGFTRVLREGDAPGGPDALYRTGAVAIRDSPLGFADAALALRETRPELRIKDPFQLTPAQLDAAVELLAARNGRERVYWEDGLEVIQALSAGQVRLAQALPYHLDLFRRAGRPVKAVDAPATTGWVGSWMLGAGATSPNCAYRWLDWVGSADVQRSAAAWTGLAPANPEACDGDARRICEIYHVRDAAWLRRVLFAARPTRDCGGLGGECTDYTDWEKRWHDLVR